MIKNNDKKINELLTRGVSEVIDREHLKKRLLGDEKMRIKLGIDPTSSNIHLGRSVPLLKLRDFQLLGHQIVFIIGDFTGVIGDTSDKDSERPMLSKEDVIINMESYIKQAGKILDLKNVEIYYNSEWLKGLDYTEIGNQADQFSLMEFISRKNIKKRLDNGNRVSLREVIYPLMQGYDSVVVKADVEIGGTDQKFNLLAGHTLQKYYKQLPQDILMTNIIIGTDGRKMSSSWGNTINLLDEPNEMFGKIMRLKDDLIISYFEHCTRVPIELVQKYKEDLLKNDINPRDLKMCLAYEITKMYWGLGEAEGAKNYFISVFQERNLPVDIKKIKMADSNIVDFLVFSKVAKSKSDARRLISQGGIRVNGEVIDSCDKIIQKGNIVQKGTRYFFEIHD